MHCQNLCSTLSLSGDVIVYKTNCVYSLEYGYVCVITMATAQKVTLGH